LRINQSTFSIFTGLFMLGTVLCHSEPPPDPAIEMKDSGITLTDGSSSYTFAKDGTFRSEPIGMSGRTFYGRWEIEDHSAGSPAKVVAEAKLGWINGLNLNDDYRRIVFVIYPGKTIPFERPDIVVGMMPENHYKCYWLIDEMSKLAKPEIAK
jgi:hypothetical protein